MKLTEVFSESGIKEISDVRAVGIDIGSRSAKAVLIANGQLYTAITATGYFMKKNARALLDSLLEQSGLRESDIDYLVGTGYGRIALGIDTIPNQMVTEISCHGLGAHYLGDNIKTIIDIGGQDSKAIKIDPENGQVVNFVMNDKCAAGTGRFLEKMANVLGFDMKNIGEKSLESTSPVQISSQCVVFAESEIISERAKGGKVEDLSMGIYLSVAKRVNNLLSRIGIEEGILFTGGVSNNVGVRAALEKKKKKKIQNAKIDTVFAGAIGAALYAQRFHKQASETKISDSIERHVPLELNRIRDAINRSKEEYIKHKTGKSKNVAYLCAYTPIEILAAADVAHIRLFHTGNPNEVSAGEKMTQSVFCDLTKSIIGKFAEEDPLYTAVDKVYTFYTCDCMKKTAEAIDNTFVTTTIFNLPRIRDRSNSAKYFKRELKAFVKDLEEFTGKKISEDEIRKQIVLYNKVKALYRRISDFRKYSVPMITSQEFQFIAKGYYYLSAEELIPLLEDIISQLEKRTPIEKKYPRFLVAGGVFAEGDNGLANIVENKLGGYIVAEDNCTGLKPFLNEIPEKQDVYEALAEGYLNKAPCIRMKPLTDNEELAAELAKDYDVDAVIFYYLKFCPGYAIAKQQFSSRFRSEDLPVLEIANDYSSNDEGQLLTRLEAFVEVIGEKGGIGYGSK